MTRISLDDSVMSAILKLSDKNPGALTVCVNLFTEGKYIDTDNILGGLGILLNLDSSGIYAERIWMLYKGVCKESLVHTIAVLRAHQMGIISIEQLNTAIDDYGKGIDIKMIYDTVKERLPNFNK